MTNENKAPTHNAFLIEKDGRGPGKDRWSLVCPVWSLKDDGFKVDIPKGMTITAPLIVQKRQPRDDG